MSFGIAGDIGGTHSRLALCHSQTGELPSQLKMVIDRDQTYLNRNFASIHQVLEEFIHYSHLTTPPDWICLALPAPIHEGAIRLTNIDWTIDRYLIQQQLPVKRVILINDFQAAALGTTLSTTIESTPLNAAPLALNNAVRVVIGPGTGLGQAFVHTAKRKHHIFATEGGHLDFAPVDEEQIALWHYLQPHYGHLSYERLLSGEGLVHLYRFINHLPFGSPTLTAAQISCAATSGERAAIQSLQLFCKIYGAFAGNMALSFRPAGGIWLVGGITEKIASWIHSGEFYHSYLAKGRMEPVVAAIPVRLVTSSRIGLHGAIHWPLNFLPSLFTE